MAGNALTEAVVFGIEAARQVTRAAIWPIETLGILELEGFFAESGIRLGDELPWEKLAGPEKWLKWTRLWVPWKL